MIIVGIILFFVVYIPMLAYTLGFFKRFGFIAFPLAIFWPITMILGIIGALIEAGSKAEKKNG